ncbi:hypothetical protein NECAME_16151 [Necator americanus]|uniref:Uncharacterized protein n=1 Tax=Necator americanus TaxID=51031 RepID=W2U0B5_NECAM|nr:hypothetical protein NECAME_16151 [Necator americanus]ETN86761.1 hypothetical protein NECAME_16151 [Necator americanus]
MAICTYNARTLASEATIEDLMMQAKKIKGGNPRTVINWDLFATLAGFWEDSATDNIDEEYDRLGEHLRDCAKKAESSKTTKRRLSLETLELIRQRGAARAAGNQELTSVLARFCREAIKEDLKERRAEVLAEAAEDRKKNRNIRSKYKTSAGDKIGNESARPLCIRIKGQELSF